jgi:uncharacterized protein DUF5069
MDQCRFVSSDAPKTLSVISLGRCSNALTIRPFNDETTARRKRRNEVVWSSRAKWSVDHSSIRPDFSAMQTTQSPCSDYKMTKGLVYFARMLDKIRLHAAGSLAPEYFVGVEDPTFFDARCTRFLGVDYDELVGRTLEGGSDEEILEWCFRRGLRPSDEQIEIWNAFLLKRGWRDDASADLAAAKQRGALSDRDDIQTWIDLHDVEEGRVPGGYVNQQ